MSSSQINAFLSKKRAYSDREKEKEKEKEKTALSSKQTRITNHCVVDPLTKKVFLGTTTSLGRSLQPTFQPYIHTRSDLEHIASCMTLDFVDLRKLEGYAVTALKLEVKPYRSEFPSENERLYLRSVAQNGHDGRWDFYRKYFSKGASAASFVINHPQEIVDNFLIDKGRLAPPLRRADQCIPLLRGHTHELESVQIAMAAVKGTILEDPGILVSRQVPFQHASPDAVFKYDPQCVFNIHCLQDGVIAIGEAKCKMKEPHLTTQLSATGDPHWSKVDYIIQQQVQMAITRTEYNYPALMKKDEKYASFFQKQLDLFSKDAEQKTPDSIPLISHSMFIDHWRFSHQFMPVWDEKTQRFLIARQLTSRLYYNEEFVTFYYERLKKYEQCLQQDTPPNPDDFGWTRELNERFKFKMIPEFEILFWLVPDKLPSGELRVTRNKEGKVIMPAMVRIKEGPRKGFPMRLIGKVVVDQVINRQSIPEFLTLIEIESGFRFKKPTPIH